MSEYLMKIMGIVLIAVILTNLLPTGKTSVLIKNNLRLCMYLCMLMPAFDFFISLKENNPSSVSEIFTNYFSETVIPTDELYIKYCSEISVENAENCIEKKILEKYGVTSEVTLQSVITDSFEIKIEEGFLKVGNFTNDELLQEICKDLQNEYAVSFKYLKGE